MINRDLTPNTIYLGDGAYIQKGRYPSEFIIFTSDGIEDSNHIYLDSTMVEVMLRYIKANQC